jgi:hypothetical protein
MDLRAGDWVEVRSAEEILSTLDELGRLDALPFMPEMLQYCGKRFRVFKSAHKACDTLRTYRNRHMQDAVHLEELRCDGAAHGGCQAGCLLFWKTAWLRPADGPSSEAPQPSRASRAAANPRCTHDGLTRATQIAPTAGASEERYRCQATEMFEATAPIRWWEVRHYFRDLSSGNVRLRDFLRYAPIATFLAAFRAVIRLSWRGRRYEQYPRIRGLASDKTPVEVLGLEPGELVRVRSKAEIMRTISAGQKNRGLWYDEEMLPYCDTVHKVLRRVDKLIDERTGKMIKISGSCIILDGVACSGFHSSNRLFCPRSIYPYWREIWLRRVD